ncbi:hypothetical protein, partial [Geofilum rhodophaeum]
NQYRQSVGIVAIHLSFSIGTTLTAPMQFLQQANNNPILSFWFIFQFFAAISKSQPSGINPSKKGKVG